MYLWVTLTHSTKNVVLVDSAPQVTKQSRGGNSSWCLEKSADLDTTPCTGKCSIYFRVNYVGATTMFRWPKLKFVAKMFVLTTVLPNVPDHLMFVVVLPVLLCETAVLFNRSLLTSNQLIPHQLIDLR